MADVDARIAIQVCHASPQRQLLLDLSLAPGCTVRQAILASGVLQQLPGLPLETLRVGVFGQLKTLDSVLQAGDRVEIYRPLKIDPKEARRQRVAGARQHAAAGRAIK